ncbi:hypothetical protein OSTOST_21540 [Ostertagia ostertagi]
MEGLKNTFANHQSVHADISIPPNQAKHPLSAGKASDILVKRLKVDYNADPFVHTSTTGVKRPSILRPIKKPTLDPSTSACAEDPFSVCTIKKESGEGDGKNAARISGADDVFRATFSSLNDSDSAPTQPRLPAPRPQ